MAFFRYLWVCTIAAVSSAAVLAPAFGLFGGPTQLLASLLFVAVVHFLFIGTVGWLIVLLIRHMGILSTLPVALVSAAIAAVAWSLFGGVLFGLQGGTQLSLPWWTFLGGFSGLTAGYLVKRLGFPDFVHREQFLQERDRATYKYRAFLSYSREDEQQAIRIWRDLDSYRVPKEIVGRPGAYGTIPNKLYPIFRDREELSSGKEVSTALSTALQDSESLIVLLSPASAKSAWVNQEIEIFIATNGSERVLPVIIRGTTDPDDPENYCIPPALSDLDILAADFRSLETPNAGVIGDGPKVAMIKLIAGLLGTDYESLQHRESAREARRHATTLAFTAFSASSTILTLVLFAVAANFVVWMLNTIDSEISAEATRLFEIHSADGVAGIEKALQFEKPGAGMCRALVAKNGTVMYGFLPDAVASEIANINKNSTFSIRYRETHEYGGSPFPLRIDGAARRLNDESLAVVALCNNEPPFFFGSFRSLFDPRTIDTVIEVRR